MFISCFSPSGTPMIQMLEHLKLFCKFLSLASFFSILMSSFYSGGMFISSFCSKLVIWVPVSFPSLLVPCAFYFISLFKAFIFSSVLWPYLTNSVSFLITSVLTCASDRLAISLWLSCIFFWSFDLFFQLGHIFLSGHSCCIIRGRALGIPQGRATHSIAALWCCMWGRVWEETVSLAQLSLAFSHFPRCPQANRALLVLIPGWVGLCTF